MKVVEEEQELLDDNGYIEIPWVNEFIENIHKNTKPPPNRIKLNINYVSNIIGDDYKEWKPGDVIIIDAQTGTGKNYFIENTLIPWISPNKKLLYLSNRTNLKREVKIRLLEKYSKEIPETLDELDHIKTIENITISSYHALQHSSLNQAYKGKIFDLSRYDYIVLDECHFVLADSGYNNLCYLTYMKLFVMQYHNITKVFMSATMQEIIEDIIKYAPIDKTHTYETGKDYSYAQVKYFKHYGYTETITNMIKNDISDEKWLIFISNLKHAKKILEALGEDNCSIIKSGTKSEELENLLKENQFKKKVLIATKALDNGINIKDDLLTNIVILAWDQTSLLQMLGRKRIKPEEAQLINLYISTRSKNAFKGLLRKYEAKQKDIDLFNLENDNKNSFNKKYDNKLSRICDDIFYKDAETNEFMLNPIGKVRLKKDIEFAEGIIVAFELDKDFAYVHQQLNWLGLSDSFDENNLIENVILDSDIDSLEDYLDSIVGKVMLQLPDREELIEKIGLIDTHNSNIKENNVKLLRNIDTLNSYLKEIELNYYIKEFETSRNVDGKKKKFKSAWKVLRGTNEVD